MTDLYSDLNVKGKITQKANQADTSLDENQHDVVIVSTLNGRVPSAIPQPNQAGKAIVVNDQGTAYTLGEAGKIDGIKLGPSDADPVSVINKYAIIPPATGSALGVVQAGTGIISSDGEISVAYGNTAGTACEGNDTRLSDARTPLSHTHGNISNDGKISSNKGSIVITNATTGAIEASGKTIETSKTNVTTSATSTVPTSAAVAGAINDAVAAIPDPMVFKGSVGGDSAGATVTWTNLPQPATGTGPMAGNEGWTYKVITKYTNTGSSDYRPSAEVGDTIISTGSAWVVIPSGDEPSGTVTSVAAGTGLTTDQTNAGPITTSGTISLADTNVSAGTYGESGNTRTLAFSGTFDVPQYTVDAQGRLTASSTKTLTLPAQPAHQTIKQDGITGATVNRFGTCSTAASTAAKTVNISSGTFSLEAGATVSVSFTNDNTANSPTLSVDSTTAKNIVIDGVSLSTATGTAYLLKGTCTFVYDGTYWRFIGANNAYHKEDTSGQHALALSSAGPSSQSAETGLDYYDRKLYYSRAGGLNLVNASNSATKAVIMSDIIYVTDGTTSVSMSIAGGFVGNLTGNASTATNVAYSGITSNPITTSNVTFADWLQE